MQIFVDNELTQAEAELCASQFGIDSVRMMVLHFSGETASNSFSAMLYDKVVEWRDKGWIHARIKGVYEACQSIQDRRNAAGQGVPFPKIWQTALRCSNLQEIAEGAAKAARDELGRDTDCKLLGVAKRTTPPEPGDHEPGGTVMLSGEGSRMAHLLCAKVDGDTWLCHRGSFLDGALNTSLPLSEHDLVGV